VFTYGDGSAHEEGAAGARLGHPSHPLSREQIGDKLVGIGVERIHPLG
jgi:hypothetical protein